MGLYTRVLVYINLRARVCIYIYIFPFFEIVECFTFHKAKIDSHILFCNTTLRNIQIIGRNRYVQRFE